MSVSMRNQLLGYTRVSTRKQTTDQQVDALVAAGVDPARIYTDVLSGVRSDRPGLRDLLAYAREGDTLVVVAMDRLGRSLSHMVRTVEELQDRGINIKSLREGLDFSTAAGRLQAAIFAALAEYERELIKERAAAAREAAQARGRQVGRPRALSPSQAETARRMREGGFDVTTIAKTLGVSRATVYRYADGAYPQTASFPALSAAAGRMSL
ncbi:recombinase family protein [Geodermatophilus sp. SYSU D00815]